MRSINQNRVTQGIAKTTALLTFMLISLFTQDVQAQDCARRAMACNNRVNIPLNENCEAIITIDMILEDQVGFDSDYELRIFDPQGNKIMSDTLREDYDCQWQDRRGARLDLAAAGAAAVLISAVTLNLRQL